MEKRKFIYPRKFFASGKISGLNQLITAVTRNCCFSISCSSFFPIFVCGNGEISGLNQLITAVTRNCCFSVSCSSFFPIFVFGNGEISVAKPQLRVAAKRWRQLRARSLINSLKICRKNWCLSGKN